MSNPYAAPEGVMNDLGFAQVEAYEPKLFQTSGRIGRVRYLGYCTMLFGITMVVFFAAGVATLIASALGVIVMGLAYLALLVAGFVLARRRLNDLDQSGWLAILLFIPLVNMLIGLWMMIGRGSEQANRFGPPPGPNTRGVIIAAWFFLAVPLIGIAAAVAIPAYQTYTQAGVSAQR